MRTEIFNFNLQHQASRDAGGSLTFYIKLIKLSAVKQRKNIQTRGRDKPVLTMSLVIKTQLFLFFYFGNRI